MTGKLPFDSQAKSRIDELREAIERHNRLYYDLAEPEIGDDAYDRLMEELSALEKRFPQWDSPDSPTHRVGASPAPSKSKKDAFPPHRHAVPMLSIANTYSSEEIRKFVGRVEGALRDGGSDSEPPKFVVELKIDGVAMTAFYRDGVFVRGATRGDGTVGEDITANLMAVKGLPKRLAAGHPGGEIEVRGEIYMSSTVFESLVRRQEEEGAARVFANPRNATAGTLKLLDPEAVAARDLACFFYQVIDAPEHGCAGQADALAALEKWGLPVNPNRGLFSTADEILAFRDAMDVERHRLPYGTDGLVVKVDSFRHQEVLGLGTKSPNWAVAYKFAPERAETSVSGIRVQVGKLGRLTPVADLEPVTLAGSTITHASLHNESYIQEKDIRVGDAVLVEKAGEIIPQIYSVVKEKRRGDAPEFAMPTKCPSCGEESETTENAGGDGRRIVLRFCVNPGCPAKQFARIVHFASRDAMDIEGMGPSVVQWLLDHTLLRDVSDIYRLRREQLMPMTKAGRELMEKGAGGEPTKVVDNLLGAIEASKGRGLAKLLFALTIPDIGETAAQLLAKRFRTMAALVGASEAEISGASMGESTSYRTLGEKAAERLAEALAREEAPYGKDVKGLEMFLEGLRLPGFGKKKCEAVARHFGDVDALLAAGMGEIALVEMGASQVKRTLGGVVARSLREYLDDAGNREMLEKLAGVGVSMEDAGGSGTGGVSGKVFVLTGTLPNLGRAEAKRLIEGAGGVVAGSVSRKVDYVVAGAEAGGKLSKAEELGVEIIDESRLLELTRSPS